MQRWARARFTVIRVNRWSVVVVLLAALSLLLLPAGDLPVVGPDSHRVAEGVTFLNRNFSGKTEDEARAMLKAMRSALETPPVAAREERDSDGVSYVVPELYGRTLDLDRTWFRLATAARGSSVEPAYQVQTPSRRLSDYPLSVIRKGNRNKQAVALMINVDWGTPELNQMLPVLKKRGAVVTFFVSGSWAEKNKELLQQMAEDGHEIATHGHRLTYGPKELARTGKLMSDIAQSVKTIQEITGVPVRYYAPHMSEVSPAILETAASLQLRTVLPSLDTVDWDNRTTPELILSRLQKAMPGDLVLMHPKPNTAAVLEMALIQLQSRGLRPVALSEMLSPDPDTPASAWMEPDA